MATKTGIAPGDPPLIDPTVLTTQQLVREITSLRELFEARMGEMATGNLLHVKNLETRLDAMDKAIELVQSNSNRLPSWIDEKIQAMQAIHEEKFSSVQTQFKERDTRTDQTSRDSKVAVDAALTAQKDAVKEQTTASERAIAKSEAATMKQIDQISVLINATNNGMNDKIDDIKQRLTSSESKSSVADPAIGEAVKSLIKTVNDLKAGESKNDGRGQGQQQIWGFIVAGVGVAVGIVALMAAFRPH